MFVYFVSACSNGCIQNSYKKCRVPRLWEKWKKRKQEKNEKKKQGKRGKDFKKINKDKMYACLGSPIN